MNGVSKLGGVLLAMSLLGCGRNQPAERTTPPRVREAAVAGLFYPQDPAALSQTLDLLLAGPAPSVPELKALILPHAGYQFSGPVAASGYRLLRGRDVRTVYLLAPSHTALFQGAYVTETDAYRTPLGDVPVAAVARQLAAVPPFTGKTRWQIQRPPWASSSPVEATPETWEHSGEVQVPFLQKTLQSFQLVPVVFGEVDPAAAARVLADRLDEQTLVIASSDLSHYHSYDEAEARDTQCVKAICSLDTVAMQMQEACGAGPILTVMHLARLKGWRAKLLDYRNSGDTAGDKSRVVGYAAIAFYAPGNEQFNHDERRWLLDLARATLREAVTHGRVPGVDESKVPAKTAAPAACFVTLTKHGQLRGCIGNLQPQSPLWQAVIANTVNAALRDSRFAPVTTNELDEIEIEISVLTEPKPLAFTSPEDLLAKLRPYRDGVILQIGDRSATYLPQVWEQIPDKASFLDSLSQKAGAAAGDWRQPGTRVSIYHVEAFKESEQ